MAEKNRGNVAAYMGCIVSGVVPATDVNLVHFVLLSINIMNSGIFRNISSNLLLIMCFLVLCGKTFSDNTYFEITYFNNTYLSNSYFETSYIDNF